MDCRPFAVIAVVMVGLVPNVQQASAFVSTTERTAASATILSPVSTLDVAIKSKKNARGTHLKGEEIRVRYVDDKGFVTSSANARLHKIIIVDLP